jgi:hypothetical protein
MENCWVGEELAKKESETFVTLFEFNLESSQEAQQRLIIPRGDGYPLH